MYTILVDESGDTGLREVLPDPSYGPTQYFCLCAAIFSEDNRPQIETALAGLPYNRGALHAQRLGHFEKIHFCRELLGLPVGLMGVISNKLTLLDYLSEAQKTPTHYYNICMQYLLERVGECIGVLGLKPDEVRIILEARNQRYDSLIAFVQAIQRTPLDGRAQYIQRLNAFSISNADKADDACFALADLGAHALFSAVRRDPRAYGLSETRYLSELAPAFVAAKSGAVLPKGIKPIHSVRDLGLPSDTEKAISSLRNPVKDYCRL